MTPQPDTRPILDPFQQAIRLMEERDAAIRRAGAAERRAAQAEAANERLGAALEQATQERLAVEALLGEFREDARDRA